MRAPSSTRRAGHGWTCAATCTCAAAGFIDTTVDAVASPTAPQVRSPLRGKAGLGVAYWLCSRPDQALSPTGHSTELGFAASTISTATAALAEAGLVDGDRRAVLPELFWELAGAWRPQWTWLAARPSTTRAGR